MQAHVHATDEGGPATIFLGLLLAVIAPITAAGWALANWWPISGAVWLGATLLVWLVLFASATDEVAA